MRLINTRTLQLEEFLGWIPEYAILSHRWMGDEISFPDFHDPDVRQSSRFAKIKNCCEFARRQNQLKWVWIDTCCIDKKDNAEFTEAINSMYNWYQKASKCYAYLADVLRVEDERGDWTEQSRMDFRNSAWFRRGWTLQELLAPMTVIFLDCNWNTIGISKHHHIDSFAKDVSRASGISEADLESPGGASVAKKMSWLSRRETTRIEDMAYCMLGIFDVYVPLLYGEGRKAFTRLQLEIINTSDDEWIFAWFPDEREISQFFGVLAHSPKYFASSGNIVRHSPMPDKKPYSMTNKGLQYQVPYPQDRRAIDEFDRAETCLLLLDCGIDKGRFDEETESICFELEFDSASRRWWRKRDSHIKVTDKKNWNDVVAKPHRFETLYIETDSRKSGLHK